MYMPEEEKFLSSKDELIVQMKGLLGGRAAEMVAFGTMTTGASNDIQRATSLAKHMVSIYGMSDELGLMATASVQHQYLEGQAYMDCSQETAAKVDAAVQKLLQNALNDSVRILTENRALLDEISEYLLVKETISGEELMAYVNAGKEKAEEIVEETAEEIVEETTEE